MILLAGSNNCPSCLVDELNLLNRMRETLPDDIVLFCINYAFDDFEMKTRLRILETRIPVFSGKAYNNIANLLKENLYHFDLIFMLLDTDDRVIKVAACSANKFDKAETIVNNLIEVVTIW